MAALHWLVQGYGYEVTGLDVLNAYSHTMKAAENAGRVEEARRRIHELVAAETFGQRFVTQVRASSGAVVTRTPSPPGRLQPRPFLVTQIVPARITVDEITIYPGSRPGRKPQPLGQRICKSWHNLLTRATVIAAASAGASA